MGTRSTAIGFLSWLALATGLSSSAQERPMSTASPVLVVRAARMLDVKRGAYVNKPVLVIEAGRLSAVGPGLAVPEGARVLDLGEATILPGLIDAHTHLMARFQDSPEGLEYERALLTKSQAFRTLEGAANARATLRAGYTTVRDVENEGTGYADVALRDAIRQGLVEGPRMLVATQGIAAVGQYHPFGISSDLVEHFPTGARLVSGVEEARRAAREQLGQGADLLKVYADWRNPTLTEEEIRVIVEEAHKAQRKVAVHATTPEGIRNALRAGADSIEHGHQADRAALELMKQKGAYFVPTLGIVETLAEQAPTEAARQHRLKSVEPIRQIVKQAHALGIPVVTGYDASSPTTQGQNAREIVALQRAGLPAIEAVRAATSRAAQLLGLTEHVGSLEPGRYGDLIAVTGNPLEDVTELTRVRFVMKGGEVVRDDLPHPTGAK
jgi:imidazolonepropionase-like amidohydrolase